MSDAWHLAYSRWYDHDRAGHRTRAVAWGWLADRICRITKATASGVNAEPGYCIPDGADDAPDKAKAGVPAPPCSAGRSDHECVFVEEEEPSGRLVLPPCLICGLAAMDAIEQLRAEAWERGHFYCSAAEAGYNCLNPYRGRVEESGTDDELNLD